MCLQELKRQDEKFLVHYDTLTPSAFISNSPIKKAISEQAIVQLRKKFKKHLTDMGIDENIVPRRIRVFMRGYEKTSIWFNV